MKTLGGGGWALLYQLGPESWLRPGQLGDSENKNDLKSWGLSFSHQKMGVANSAQGLEVKIR